MSLRWLWRHLRSGLEALLKRDRVERDLADEVESYLSEAQADLEAQGFSPSEARRRVRLEYGDGLAAREDVRDYGWENSVANLGTDLRVASRRLVRDPGFSVVAILTLGLGIGAATAIFSAVSPVLFEPLPYPEAERVFSISDLSDDGSLVQVTYGTYLELTARNSSFETLSVFKPWTPTLTGGAEAERLSGQRVSAEYFDVLGMVPILGAGFTLDADRPDGPNLVVLSDRVWRRRYEADPSVLGQVVHLDSQPFTVVGIMPAVFENVTSPTADVWALLQYDPGVVSYDTREWGHHLDLLGRTRPGVEPGAARRSLDAIAANPSADFPRPSWASLDRGFSVRRLKEASTANARPAMLVLLGAVALLLAIACLNLTILLLARGSRRAGELAMRMALGASRARIVSYLLTESLVLAVLGGVTGLAIARLGFSGLLAVRPPSLQSLDAASIDGTALLFALTLTTAVCVAVGLIPAIAQAKGVSPEETRATGRDVVRGTARARKALVAIEVAVAVVLLTGAGLLFRSTQRVFSIAPGFDPSSTLVFQVSTTGHEGGDSGRHLFFETALEAIRTLPSVTSAAMTSQLPLSGDMDIYGFARDVAESSESADGPAYRYAASVDYFETMGIDLVQGRGLQRSDLADAPPVAVVSESLARRLVQGGDPVGTRFQFGAATEEGWTVVGVVADVRQSSLGSIETDAVYVSTSQWHWADAVRWLVVRSDVAPESLVPLVRGAIRAVDEDQPIVRVQSMADLVAMSEVQRSFVLLVLTAFAFSALALAGVGLFGVLSGSVTERMREIGVRGALGATEADIVAIVVRSGMTVTLIGILAGATASVVASEALVTLLFGVSRLDFATYLGVVTLIALVSALACWIPAARAARIDPVEMLRAD